MAVGGVVHHRGTAGGRCLRFIPAFNPLLTLLSSIGRIVGLTLAVGGAAGVVGCVALECLPTLLGLFPTYHVIVSQPLQFSNSGRRIRTFKVDPAVVAIESCSSSPHLH